MTTLVTELGQFVEMIRRRNRVDLNLNLNIKVSHYSPSHKTCITLKTKKAC